MKKILVILVGGTICSELNENGCLAVGDGAGLCLVDNFYKNNPELQNEVCFEFTENLYILSENMTVEKWNRIIEIYKKYTEKEVFDGVLIAHGTDTLGFSAALFSIFLSSSEIPVIFVSSNKPLSENSANGYDNFGAAVNCILQEIPKGVYVTYKNTDGNMYLHLASRMKQSGNYSEDFESGLALEITGVKDVLKAVKDWLPKRECTPFIKRDFKLKNCVLMIKPYVGINYSIYDYKKFSCVLHGTYHSGTVSAEDGEYSVFYMIKECEKSGTDVCFSPSKARGTTYESLMALREYNENSAFSSLLYGFTDEMAYAKLLIAYSVFDNKKERLNFIETEYNYEKIYSQEG